MNRRTLIRCIALAPLATGVSCDRAASNVGLTEKLPPGHDPRDFGALADGKTLDTAAIQAAIDAAANSLGRVNLTGAVFLSGSLILISGISFHIASDATLLGSTDPAHYRTGRWPALLLANSATDLHLSGKGTIDGQGRELTENIMKLLRAGKLTDPPDLKRPSERHRPQLIEFIRIRDLAITVPATAPDAGYPHAGPPVKRPHNVIPASIVGLPGHPVENVTLENIRITMPGGADPAVAHIPLDELQNMPDLPQRYPEFSMFGELPSWALFLRHTRGIVLRESRFDLKSPDFRPAVILGRSVDTELDGISLDRQSGRPLIAAHASPDLRILNPPQPLGNDDLRSWKTEAATP